jgi:transposase
LGAEIDALEKVLAEQSLGSPEILRLMTVPGVNVVTAATFIASVGDVRRFSSPRKLVGYLGLDPRVRRSGNEPARHGRISKAGAAGAIPEALERRTRARARPRPHIAAWSATGERRDQRWVRA